MQLYVTASSLVIAGIHVYTTLDQQADWLAASESSDRA
jgi:hypothetical protein